MDARSSYRATQAVRKAWKGPLIVKLTPNTLDIVSVARAAVEGGADILSLINTLVGMAIDVKTRRPILGNVTGGLSGPAVKPVALRCVYQVAQAIDVPIIGMGGVSSYRDVLEFMMAGASAVGIGAGLLVDPVLPKRILEDLETYGRDEGISDLKSLVGAAWKG